MSGRLAGLTALVTGGAVGIGAATCRLFAREGCAVGVVDRDGAGARACAAEIAAAGGRSLALEADVTSLEAMRAAVAALEEAFGGLDVVVNNAGVIGRGTVETTEEDEWRRVLDVNLTGVYLTSKAAVPALARRGGGSIINVSSAAGLAAWYDQAAYDASKGGVVNLTRSMALDLAEQGIRANCLVPAHVVTPMS
jgi:NAD(P)-dependent dehydrogenase (short-subunit alcohol dehydrogenase family)